MTAPELQATKRYTVLNTRDNVAQQIARAQENNYHKIVFDVESEAGNLSELTLTYRHLEPSDTRDDLLLAVSERKEDVTVNLPKNPEEPAIAILPN